jgi:hypothetical protein
MTNTNNNDLATRYECMDVDGMGGLFCLSCATIYAEEREISINAESDDNAVAWASEDFYNQYEYAPCDSCGKK